MTFECLKSKYNSSPIAKVITSDSELNSKRVIVRTVSTVELRHQCVPSSSRVGSTINLASVNYPICEKLTVPLSLIQNLTVSKQ